MKRLLSIGGCLTTLVALPMALSAGLMGMALSGGSLAQYEEGKPYLARAAGLFVVAVVGLVTFAANLKAFKHVERVTHPRARD